MRAHARVSKHEITSNHGPDLPPPPSLTNAVYADAGLSSVSPPIYSERLEPFPENPEEALALDPLPPTAAGRKVIIAQKSKPATTSGTGGGLHSWNLTFKQQVRAPTCSHGGVVFIAALRKRGALGFVVGAPPPPTRQNCPFILREGLGFRSCIHTIAWISRASWFDSCLFSCVVFVTIGP